MGHPVKSISVAPALIAASWLSFADADHQVIVDDAARQVGG